MAARSWAAGHPIEFDGKDWRFSDTGGVVHPRPCADCSRATVPVRVWLQAELSCTRKARWKKAQIDACLAPIVKALQRAGIDMRSSCCGHGKGSGEIILADGRILKIHERKEAEDDR